MPRRARLIVPGIPLHIIQRGVNRCGVFLDKHDREHYLGLLYTSTKEHGIDIHAYVLMGNHVHLLVTGQESGTISAAMHRLGQCYVQAFNRRYGRTGTLFEGRYKSCLVDSDAYLLAVYRYIELNPVRAAMTDAPEHHFWSSAQGNLGIRFDPLLTPHSVFLALSANKADRFKRYACWLKKGIRRKDLEVIRAYLQQEKALGSSRFRAMVERTLGRNASWRPRGRPPKGGHN